MRIPDTIHEPGFENAIWHGLSHKSPGDRKIEIRVHPESMSVKYEIEDNSVGRQKAAELKTVYRKAHRSKGMELLTKRFRLVSQEYRHQMETQVTDMTENNEPAGTRVAILVPWEMARENEKIAS